MRIHRFTHVIARQEGVDHEEDFHVTDDFKHLYHRKGLDFADGVRVGLILAKRIRRQKRHIRGKQSKVLGPPLGTISFASVPMFENILPH